MHRVKAASVLLTALLLLLIASVAIAQYAPDVLIVDQDMVDGEVAVARATVNGPGWVVIYADDGGEPGEIIGYAPLMNGINANIMVELDPDALTDTLYAVLHEDLGFAGTFEYPGDDVPVAVDDEMVVSSFQVTGSGKTIAGIVSENEGFGKLLAALQAADLLDSLRADGPFTLFAPTDEAFDALPDGELDELLKDTEALAELLRYHVAAGQISAGDLTDGLEAETLQGTPLTFAVDGSAVSVNDAAVSESDIGAVNGIIHVVSSLLVPPSEEEAIAEAEAAEAEEVAGAESAETVDDESAGLADMANQVTAFVQSFLTLRQDEPAEAMEEAEVADAETSDEAAASDEATADEEVADAEGSDATAETEEIVEEVVETEEPSGIADMASQVGAFVQSFLTLRQDEPVEAEAMEEAEVADAETADETAADDEAMADEGEGVEEAADEEVADAESSDATVETEEVIEEVVEIDEPSGMASQVGAFVQSFLTLRQDEPVEAETMEEAEVADAEPADETAAEDEAMADEGEGVEEAAAEEVAEAEGSDAKAKTEEVVEEVVETEEPSGVSDMASQVGAFVQSFLTLRQDDPAETEETAAEASDEAMSEEQMDVVDTAIAADEFQTLADALQAANLVDALKGEGPFTLFAPTDDAFAALPDGLLDELLQDQDKLTQVLLYHVVPDRLMAADIAKMGSVLTLEGDMLPFAVDGDNVMSGNAVIAETDIEAANGVIHVIDQVLLPPSVAEVAAEEEIVEEEIVEEEIVEEEIVEEEVAEEPTGTDEALDLTGVAEAAALFMQNLLTLSDHDAVTDTGDEEMAAEGEDEAMADEGQEEAVPEGDDAAAAAEGGEEMADEGQEETSSEGDDATVGAEDDAMADESQEGMASEGDDTAMAGDDDAVAVPEDLPETGLSLSAGATTVPVVLVVMMLLVVGAFVTRRRPA